MYQSILNRKPRCGFGSRFLFIQLGHWIQEGKIGNKKIEKEIAGLEELDVFFGRPNASPHVGLRRNILPFYINGINFLIFLIYFCYQKPGPGSGSIILPKRLDPDPDLDSAKLDHQDWPKLGRKHNL
jgi:hypothetical protein